MHPAINLVILPFNTARYVFLLLWFCLCYQLINQILHCHPVHCTKSLKVLDQMFHAVTTLTVAPVTDSPSQLHTAQLHTPPNEQIAAILLAEKPP